MAVAFARIAFRYQRRKPWSSTTVLAIALQVPSSAAVADQHGCIRVPEEGEDRQPRANDERAPRGATMMTVRGP